MAGMLPGVEFARRRRLHQSGGWSDSSTRRSSLCLYASNHETHQPSSSYFPLMQRGMTNQTCLDEKLEEVAREAKERLDGRLRAQRTKPESTTRGQKLRCEKGRSMVLGALHTEVHGSRKGVPRKFRWAKLSWKPLDQDECPVCLESFKVGETLLHLPCAHRFHSRCLEPWLENNSHCPCCRMGIIA